MKVTGEENRMTHEWIRVWKTWLREITGNTNMSHETTAKSDPWDRLPGKRHYTESWVK